MNPKPLSEVFAQLCDAIAGVSPAARAMLSPGIAKETSETLLRENGFVPPQELLELFSLADGSISVPGIEILPGAYFQPLKTSIAAYEIASPIAEDAWGDLAKALPVFTDYCGGGYGVRSTEGRGEIVSLGNHEPPSVAFLSLTNLLELSLACYEEGVFRWEDGMMETDWEKYALVGQRFTSPPPEEGA